jgi:hypothetical protein
LRATADPPSIHCRIFRPVDGPDVVTPSESAVPIFVTLQRTDTLDDFFQKIFKYIYTERTVTL